MRHLRVTPALIALGLSLALLAAACGDDDSASTSNATDSTAPSTGSDTSDSETTTTGPTVALSISSGLNETLEVTRCDNPGETTITLEAQTNDLEDPLVMNLDAAGGTGTIVLSGADEAEGTVDEIMVGDTGEITASGMITAADDSATTTDTWQLTGNCA